MISRLFTFFILAGTCVGCSIYARSEPDRAPRPLTPDILSAFAYVADEADPQVSEFEDAGDYLTRLVEFPPRPDEVGDGPARAIEYRPQSRPDAVRPGIVVMPILGGDYAISAYLAEYIAARGFACLRFLRPGRLLDRKQGLGRARAMYCRAVIDVRRGLDWWTEQDGLDVDRLGIVGISQGGILSTATLAVEPRLKVGAFLLAGGGIAELMLESEEPSVVRFRNTVMEREGWSEAEFYARARESIGPIDVTRLAEAIETRRVMMVHGRYDRSVLPRHGDALWRALGRPDRVVYPFGHYSSILMLPFAARLVVEHLRTVLREEGR